MSRRYIRIVNWDRYQHYKNRRPPWIKLYTDGVATGIAGSNAR